MMRSNKMALWCSQQLQTQKRSHSLRVNENMKSILIENLVGIKHDEVSNVCITDKSLVTTDLGLMVKCYWACFVVICKDNLWIEY